MKKLIFLALLTGLTACAPETPKTEKPAEPAAKAAVPEAPKPEEPKAAETKTEPAKTDAKADAKVEPAAKTAAAPKTEAKPDAKAGDKAAAPVSAAKAPAPANADPSVYRVLFTTSKGDFVIEVNRTWAPLGAARFYELVQKNFFDDARFFRALPGFMVQFGIPGDPKVAAEWRPKIISDDPVKQSNTRGMVTFATGGPNTRTTQVFINYGDNVRLDLQGFSPFGKVVSGMEVVESLYGGYGEGPPSGRGPDQSRVQMEGNTYLKKDFPMLDYVKTARLAK